MLVHINQKDVAEIVHNAWLRTIEDGVHTYDIFKEGTSKQKVGTKEFADAVIDRLGQEPQQLGKVSYSSSIGEIKVKLKERPVAEKKLVGVDIFLQWNGKNPDELGEQLKQCMIGKIKLKMITNRGTKVYPGGHPETFCTDHWRCRFVCQDHGDCEYQAMIYLLQKVHSAGFDIIKTENLYYFNGQPAFSAAQGE
jgi:isocitrate dehydrogenase